MNLELIHAIEKMGNVKIQIEGHNLHVDYLNLNFCTGLTELPENLHVNGSLHLSGCTSLTKLPKNLHVEGSLYLSGCTGITKLPANLHVKSWLDLYGCTGLTELPDNLHVEDSLYLGGCTSLTELPDNLHVDGWLDLYGCTSLTKLPENLHVKGDLDLYGCTHLKSNEHYIISEDIGSRSSKTVYNISTGMIKYGCFTGTLDKFEKRVHEVYPSGEYRKQYDEYIELCRNRQLNNN